MGFCRKYLDLKRWPTILVFLLAGGVATGFAFVTVNLFTYAMANVGFIKKHGIDAIRHGALWQVAELTMWGALALFYWVTFKICEHVLVARYFSWTEGRHLNPAKDTLESARPKDPRPHADAGLSSTRDGPPATPDR